MTGYSRRGCIEEQITQWLELLAIDREDGTLNSGELYQIHQSIEKHT
jgi:hypothetical protein